MRVLRKSSFFVILFFRFCLFTPICRRKPSFCLTKSKDRPVNSTCNIITLLKQEVTKINKIINWEILSLYKTKFSELTL